MIVEGIAMRIVNVAVLQMELPCLCVQENVEKAEKMVRAAYKEGAQVVCLPEIFNVGYHISHFAEMLNYAEDTNGPTLMRFKQVAKELGIYIIAPILEDVGGGMYANTPFVIDMYGEIIGRYPKSHILRSEEGHFVRGSNYIPVDTPFGKIGVMTCNDLCFPEVARMFAINGTELLFVPAAWQGVSYMVDWWDRCLAARALDNQIFVAAANHCGVSSHGYYAGNSKILNPRGDTLVKAGLGEEMVLKAIDLDSIQAEREYNTSFYDRRPQEYGLIARE